VAHRVTGAPHDYDPLMDRVGNARFVLIGEATHGVNGYRHYNVAAQRRWEALTDWVV